MGSYMDTLILKMGYKTCLFKRLRHIMGFYVESVVCFVLERYYPKSMPR